MAEKIKYEHFGKCLLINGDKGKKILVIGDLHLGYEESMNESGIFVSRQMFDEMIKELEMVFEKVGEVNEIVLLGDLKHEMGGILRQEWNDILGFWDYLHEKMGKKGKIVVTRGNHDNYLLNIASKRDFVEIRDYYISGEYCFMHGDKDYEEIWEQQVKYWVMGHAHPAVNLKDDVKVEKYKCFLEGKYKDKIVVIVPSFIEYNEGTDVRERDFKLAWNFDFGNFEVYIVGENLEVLSFGKLKTLKN